MSDKEPKSAPSAPQTPNFPRQFGKYHLLSPLAQGGMGALYIAVAGERGLERLLVIKTVLPHLADDEYVARFRDEAKVVVQLSHQNLIPVFDAGQVDGELFLAMDLVEGKDLRAIWNRCAKKAVAFPLDVAAFVVKELCRGLDYAHKSADLELVHRDVSPPNVIVSYRGEVKLTDFGLAASTLKLEKTAPGIVYGKVSYMSPEQARGERLDGRSDLYAAGIIFWELLTGRQLFPASSDQGQDLLGRSQDPDVALPSSRAPRVPAALDLICEKALAADPDDRYQSGEEFREALATWLAKNHPSTDAARVERFLGLLFAEDIASEHAHRSELLSQTRERIKTLPPSHELHQLFSSVNPKDLDRRGGEGPNLGRRDADWGTSGDRRSVGGRRAVDKIAEGVGTMLGLQPGSAKPGEEGQPMPQTSRSGGQAAVAIATPDILLVTPKGPDEFIGTILDGRYQIEQLIGEGGMGRVYSGEHVEIGRTVAIKILHAVYSNMPDLVERFRREARAATKIGHPNIVDVTDSGTTGDGSAYFVMEYLDGVELGSVIDKEGALEVGRALAVATQICRALAAAHAVDIIHRDLKPENVFLTTKRGSSDFVKVLDFGIAKSGEAEKARERRLTSPGVAMGTPEYMAPEQAAGKPADERSDIYAVGAILYEMLSGYPPYEGDNFMEILSKKATKEPTPLDTLRADIPAEVVAIVNQSMERDPGRRPSSMESLEYELTKLSSGRGAAVANAIGLSAEATGDVPRTNPPGLSGRAIRSPASAPVSSLATSAAEGHDEFEDPTLGDADTEISGLVEETADPSSGPLTIAEDPNDHITEVSEDVPTQVSSQRLAVPLVEHHSARASRAVAPVEAGVPAVTAPRPFESNSLELPTIPSRTARVGRSVLWGFGLGTLALLIAALVYMIMKEPGEQPNRTVGPPSSSTSPPAQQDVEPTPTVFDKKNDSNTPAQLDSTDAGVESTDAGSLVAVSSDGGLPVDASTSPVDSGSTAAKPNDTDRKPLATPAELLKKATSALNSGNFDDAEVAFKNARAAGAPATRVNLGLARVEFNRGHKAKAVLLLQQAGNGYGAQLLLGQAYQQQQNCRKAVGHFRRALKRKPSSKAAKTGIDACSP